MGDPRNIAHGKKVSQEKQHKGEAGAKKPAASTDNSGGKQSPPTTTARTTEPTQLEKSLAVLSKIKEMEFHSRSNIEKLAELSLTIEEELKQKVFAEAIAALYSAQDAFQTKVVSFIEAYEAECERLKPKQ
jgi:hypothetical protein